MMYTKFEILTAFHPGGQSDVRGIGTDPPDQAAAGPIICDKQECLCSHHIIHCGQLILRK